MVMRVTVGPICWQDLKFWEACSLPGTQIRGVTEMLPRPLQNPLNATPCTCSVRVLIALLGMSLYRLKATVKLWEQGGEGVRSPGGFFVNSADQRSRLRDRCDTEINIWVSRWCCQQNVCCLDHVIMFLKAHGMRDNCTSLSHQLTDLLRQVHKAHQIGVNYSALNKNLNIDKNRGIYHKVKGETKRIMVGWSTKHTR